jgi:hypothetical protein
VLNFNDLCCEYPYSTDDPAATDAGYSIFSDEQMNLDFIGVHKPKARAAISQSML